MLKRFNIYYHLLASQLCHGAVWLTKQMFASSQTTSHEAPAHHSAHMLSLHVYV